MLRRRIIIVLAVVCFLLLAIILINNLMFYNLASDDLPFDNKDFIELGDAREERFFLEPGNDSGDELYLRIYERYNIKAKENKNNIYYKSGQAYTRHFEQQKYIFLLGEYVKIEDYQAPAGAGEGYLSWFGGSTLFLPVLNAIEIELCRTDAEDDSPLKVTLTR